MYYLPRDNENIEKDILPAVLNGKYIDTNEVEEEINLWDKFFIYLYI